MEVPFEDIKLVPLAEPRGLRPDERRLLELAVDAPGAPEQLRLQAESALVVSECNCGCPSIGLRSDGPPIPDAAPAISLEARALNTDGAPAEVNLHIFDGLLHELEIWCIAEGPSEDPEVLTAPLDLATFEYCGD